MHGFTNYLDRFLPNYTLDYWITDQAKVMADRLIGDVFGCSQVMLPSRVANLEFVRKSVWMTIGNCQFGQLTPRERDLSIYRIIEMWKRHNDDWYRQINKSQVKYQKRRFIENVPPDN